MKHHISTKGATTEAPAPLFTSGTVVMTTGVKGLIEGDKLELVEVIDLLSRHMTGDWGDLDAHDKRQNEEALRDGSRLFSAYRSTAGDRLWFITEAASDGAFRASTTVLLLEEH